MVPIIRELAALNVDMTTVAEGTDTPLVQASYGDFYGNRDIYSALLNLGLDPFIPGALSVDQKNAIQLSKLSGNGFQQYLSSYADDYRKNIHSFIWAIASGDLDKTKALYEEMGSIVKADSHGEPIQFIATRF